MSAFGTKFILVSKVRQLLPPIFRGPKKCRIMHLGTAVRGFKEYIVYKFPKENEIYVEEMDASHPGLFKKIEDDSEWLDILNFFKSHGCISEDHGEKSIDEELHKKIFT